jgi:hypothetical protein
MSGPTVGGPFLTFGRVHDITGGAGVFEVIDPGAPEAQAAGLLPSEWAAFNRFASMTCCWQHKADQFYASTRAHTMHVDASGGDRVTLADAVARSRKSCAKPAGRHLRLVS